MMANIPHERLPINDKVHILFDTQATLNCPPGNTFLSQVRSSPTGALRDGPGSFFLIICKEAVQYCVEQRIAHAVNAGRLTMADIPVGAVVAVGEYANHRIAAHNSLLHILSNLLPVSHDQRTTITSIDLPAHSKDICSGCNLPRDKSTDSSKQLFKHSKSDHFPTEPVPDLLDLSTVNIVFFVIKYGHL